MPTANIQDSQLPGVGELQNILTSNKELVINFWILFMYILGIYKPQSEL